MKAYLLSLWGVLRNVIHQYGHEFRHSVYSGSKCAVWRGAVYLLPLSLCLLKPFAGYRVYDVEHAQFVRSRRLLEVGVNFLNQNRFRLNNFPS